MMSWLRYIASGRRRAGGGAARVGRGTTVNVDHAGGAGSVRASHGERDAALATLQDAFAEGRLDDAEFDGRMRAALTASRTRARSAGPAAGRYRSGTRPWCVEMTGFGISQGPDDPHGGITLAPDAPVLHIRGIAYKGTIETMSRPAERPQLP